MVYFIVIYKIDILLMVYQGSLKGKGRDAIDGWKHGRAWAKFVLFSLCFSYCSLSSAHYHSILRHLYSSACILIHCVTEQCSLRSRMSSLRNGKRQGLKQSSSFIQFALIQEEIKEQAKKVTCFLSFAVITKYHRLSSLNNRNLLTPSSGGRKVQGQDTC